MIPLSLPSNPPFRQTYTTWTVPYHQAEYFCTLAPVYIWYLVLMHACWPYTDVRSTYLTDKYIVFAVCFAFGARLKASCKSSSPRDLWFLPGRWRQCWPGIRVRGDKVANEMEKKHERRSSFELWRLARVDHAPSWIGEARSS